MTWSITIDESGNLGKDSRHFVMAAIITRRQRFLLNAAKSIPRREEEVKFYNATDKERIDILKKISDSNIEIAYVVVDKEDKESKHYGVEKNQLYEAVLHDLVLETLKRVNKGDVNITLDRNSFISLKSFRHMVESAAKDAECNLQVCDKSLSHQNRCIQLVDFVAGAIYRSFENKDDHYLRIIDNRVSVARKN